MQEHKHYAHGQRKGVYLRYSVLCCTVCRLDNNLHKSSSLHELPLLCACRQLRLDYGIERSDYSLDGGIPHHIQDDHQAGCTL